MTEQEITQARADIEQLDIEQLRCGVMLQLLNIEVLTKNRDALQAALKQTLSSMGQQADTLRAERDALQAAAKLALDAMESNHHHIRYDAPRINAAEFHAAIAALKKAGV